MPHIFYAADEHFACSQFPAASETTSNASLCPWASTTGGEIPGSGIAGSEGLHIEILVESIKLLSDKVILICVHEACRQCH